MDNLTKTRQRRLERNLQTIADVIDNNGSKYWGLYTKLEDELKDIKKKLQKHIRQSIE